MRDVIVQGAGDEGVVAISREPGVLGDTVVIHVPTDDAGAGLRVRVVESQPVVVDGTVRHRLRLLELEGSSARRAAADAVQRGTAPQ
jgi:hypothetical protein